MGTPYITGGPPRYAHQTEALKKMITTRGVTALLMEPGLGKTAPVIDYAGLLALKSPRREARVLVVCPLVAIDTWVDQTRKFASPQVRYWAEALGGSLKMKAEALAARGGNPLGRSLSGARKVKGMAPRALHRQRSVHLLTSDPVDALDGPESVPGPKIILEVVNIDMMSSRSQVGSKTMADVVLDSIKRFDPDLVVVDEAHKIKSQSSNSSRLLSRISHHVPRRMILTGTVMPHSPLDVFGQWRFLAPYAFGTPRTGKQATWGRFKERYARLGGWMGKEVIGFKNLDEMQSIMGQNAIVAKKEDALDLPEATDVVIPVHLSPQEQKAYREMKDDLATQLSSGSLSSVPNRLAQMMRLRQITSGHLPDDQGNVTVVGDSKARVIKSLVHDTLAAEKRVVIFCLFTAEINLLANTLKASGTDVEVIMGGTPDGERMRIRHRFGSDDPARIILIAQVKTMSLAVNELVTASHAIFGSLSQQRDDVIQARDRLNRIGQKNKTTFWFTVAPGTVDQVILDAHETRTNLEQAMLKHVQEVDQGESEA